MSPARVAACEAFRAADRDVEVVFGGGADPVVAVAEVDHGQVAVENLVLAGLAVELAGQDGLADLADQGALLVGEGQLDVLLGDGRAALQRPVVADVVPEGPQGAAQVDAAVVVEVAVLVGDHRLLEHLGDLGLGDRDVAVVLLQGGDLMAVSVVEDRRQDGRVGLRDRDGRRQRQEDQAGQDGHGEGRRARPPGPRWPGTASRRSS